MFSEKNEGLSVFLSKIYLWMFIGLFISGFVGYYSSTNYTMLKFIGSFYPFIIILELVIVILFNTLKNKVSYKTEAFMFIVYSLISGLTFSSIFLVYNIGSILKVFLSASALFALLAIYGFITKQDLSNLGKIFLFGILAVIVISLINIFIGSSRLDIILSVVSIVLFLGLTAFDMQCFKMIYNGINDETELKKAAIHGALSLYLDFINIFLDLLRLFGSRKK